MSAGKHNGHKRTYKALREVMTIEATVLERDEQVINSGAISVLVNPGHVDRDGIRMSPGMFDGQFKFISNSGPQTIEFHPDESKSLIRDSSLRGSLEGHGSLLLVWNSGMWSVCSTLK